MALKGYDYTLSDSGIQEAYHEAGIPESDSANHPFLVFCDAISSEEGTESRTASHAAAALVEQSLTESLNTVDGPLEEMHLREAFLHANRKLLDLFGDDDGSLAVSAVVMATTFNPSADKEHGDSLLIAGVGDVCVYGMTPDGPRTIFFDPQTPSVETDLSSEERYLALHNALGVGDHMQVHTKRYSQHLLERYIVVTHGVDSQLTEADAAELGLRPQDTLEGISQHMESMDRGPHAVRIMAVAFEANQTTPLLTETATVESADPLIYQQKERRKKERRAALGLSVAACAVVGVVAFQMFTGDVEQDTSQPNLALIEENVAEPSTVAALEPQQDSAWIMALREQVRMKDEKVETLTAQLESEQTRIDMLQAELTKELDPDAQKTVQKLMNRLSRQESELRELRLKRDQQNQKLSSSNMRLSEVQKTSQMLKDELSSARKQLHGSVATKAPSQNGLAISKAQAQINRLQMQLDQEKERNKQLTEDLRAKLQEVANASQEGQEAESVTLNYRQQLTALEERFLREKERTHNLQSELHRVTEDLTDAQTLLSASKEAQAAYQNQYQALEDQLTSKLDAVSQAYDKERSKQETMRQEFAGRLKELNAELQQEKEQHHALAAEYHSRMDQAQSRKESIANQVVATATQHLENQLNEARTALKETERRNAELQRRLSQTTSLLETRGSSLAALSAEDAAQDAHFEARLQEMSLANRQLETQNAALHQELASVLAAQNSSATESGRKKTHLSKRLETLNHAYENEKETTSILKEELQQALSRIEELDNSTMQSDALIAELNSAKNELQTALKSNNALRAEVLAATEVATRHQDQLAEARANQTHEDNQQTIRVQQLEASLAKAEQRGKLLESELNKVLEKTASYDELMDGSQADLYAANQEIRRLEQEQANSRKEKSNLLSKIAGVERYQELYETERELRLRKEREIAELSQDRKSRATNLTASLNTRPPPRSTQTTPAVQAVATQQPHQAATTLPLTNGSKATRVHLVSRGDTLSGLAVRYYGSAGRWKDIYEANQGRIPDKNRIKIGTALVIP